MVSDVLLSGNYHRGWHLLLLNSLSWLPSLASEIAFLTGCYELSCIAKKGMVTSKPPAPKNVTLLDVTYERVINPIWLLSLLREEYLETDTKTHGNSLGDGRGRDCRNADARPGIPRIRDLHQKIGRGWASLLWFGSGIFSKGLCVEGLLPNVTMFSGGAFGKWPDHEGSHFLHELVHWQINTLMLLFEGGGTRGVRT